MSYPRKPMKKILLSIAMLISTLLYTTNAMAASGKIEQDSGPYHVIMNTDPEKLTINQAENMTLLIQNKATGQPVTGAKVMMMQSWTTSGR